MPEQERHLKTATPGATIAKYAFTYSRSFYEFAELKLPELQQYPPDKARGTWLQAAIVVSTLIQMERRSGGAGTNELRADVARAFPPSVEHRHLAAIQDLSCRLLQSDRAALPPRDIPSFAGLAGALDQKLVGEIGAWLALAIAKKKNLEPADQKVAATIGRSAWTSAAMIVRMLVPKAKA